VLTLASREKVYGSAITFYEEYDEERLTEAQRKSLNLQKFRRKCDRHVFANRCVCLLSRWPFFEAFEEFLFFLHKVGFLKKPGRSPTTSEFTTATPALK
jgi:hypothetical protein